ncbi:MAG: hypothetical protein C5B56_01280 [Proteobacteria bacterium]|nr:MAG: hypothetical protein C5B56_01280 [Pseudomonadota bacterium]
MVALICCIVAAVWAQSAAAQEPQCQLYKVQPPSLNVSKEPRGDAAYIDVLSAADVVCVTREQKVGDRDWGFIDHKLSKTNQRIPVQGWANLRLLQRSSDSANSARAAPAPSAAAPAAEEVVRFNTPLTTGPYPVNGSSLEQLVTGTPLFPPIEGLDEKVWKKPCSACHKWDRQTVCEQGASYIKDPKMALRGSHPYGGAEKIAMMQWAKTGCQ